MGVQPDVVTALKHARVHAQTQDHNTVGPNVLVLPCSRQCARSKNVRSMVGMCYVSILTLQCYKLKDMRT